MEPTITSKAMPTAPSVTTTVPSKDMEQFIPDDQIVAKPLRSPNFINLIPKNKTLSLYWGNKSVGESESALRYNQLLAMGFVQAKPEDVTDQFGNPCPEALAHDNRVIYGDLILLKIPRTEFIGALKFKDQTAALRVRRFGQAMEGGKEAHQAAASRELPGNALSGINTNKVGMYVPPIQGIDDGVNLATK
jgi:hypothetical protein